MGKEKIFTWAVTITSCRHKSEVTLGFLDPHGRLQVWDKVEWRALENLPTQDQILNEFYAAVLELTERSC